MSMRELIVSVPVEREAECLDCLQGEACRLCNVTQSCDGIITTFFAYINATVRLPVNPG
jgi:hypothetical protein